jgi:transcriptional regulator with XRE-family HTH domain
VSPDEIKRLRQELRCTAKELAASIGVDQATVLAWERSALFPTKLYVDRMASMRKRGPGAVVRKSKGDRNPMKVLADPQVWTLVRKVTTHAKLREEVTKLAEGYPDPADDD